MDILIVFIIGIVFGSFLNVCINRIPNGESIIFPGSHCPKCKSKISWYDNIPIISYIILKGKCRHCNEDISIQYMVIELITAFIFILIFMEYGLSYFFIKYLFFGCFLITLSVIDIKTEKVSDRVTYPMIIIGLLFALIEGEPEKYFIGAAVYNFPFLILYSASDFIIRNFKKLSEKSHSTVMGLGDVDVGIGIGMFLGYSSFMDFYRFFMFSFSIGAIISLILIFLKVKKRDEAIQFVPFVSMAGFLMILL